MKDKVLAAIIICLLIITAWLSSERAKHIEYIINLEGYFNQLYQQCRAIEVERNKLKQDRKTI